jgi:hypothetical protein
MHWDWIEICKVFLVFDREKNVNIHNIWSAGKQIKHVIKLFMPPIIKMFEALCHGLCDGVRKHLVSVNYLTNAWVDWFNFSVAYWGWLEEGSFRWSAPPLIQDGHYGRHLGFRFRILEDKHLGRLIQFFCGLLGVTRGRFLSMISTATHLAAILDLVSVDFRTNSCVDWSDFLVAHWGSSMFTMFHFSLNLIFHTPTDNFPLGGGGACATPCVVLVYLEFGFFFRKFTKK